MTNKTAIGQMLEYLEHHEHDSSPHIFKWSAAIDKASRLAAEEAKDNTQKLNYALLSALDSRIKELKEAQKPTAPASLVEDLSAWVNVGQCGMPKQWEDGHKSARTEVSRILSRYRSQTDIVGELKKLSKEIDADYGVVPSCGEVDVAYKIKNTIDEIISKHTTK